MTPPQRIIARTGGHGAVPVLRVEKLSKAYAPEQYALLEVTLTFAAGEFVCIIGRSGAGKSTLLRCMNLLVRPTSGRVELNGTDVTGASGRALRELRGRVGMIFQGFNLVRRLTVLQNVLAGRLRFRGGMLAHLSSLARLVPRGEREKAFECLRQVGIEALAYRRADQLSGGQQQRVAIARVLAQEPEAILADEPIASLDPRSADGVMETLSDIRRQRGVPVIVNLHQVEIARSFATRIVGIADGRLRFDGASAALTRDAVESIYGEAAGAAAPAGPAPAGPRSELLVRAAPAAAVV